MRQLVLVVCCIILLAVGGGVAEIKHEAPHQECEDSLPKPTDVARPNHAEVLERSQQSHTKLKLVEVKNFYLWTRHTSANATEFLDPTHPNSISNTTFEARKTHIIIHGFLGFGTEPWILSLKDKLLKLSDCNVISVDWPAGGTAMEYYTIIARVVYVAQDAALLLNKLKAKKGLRMKEVHVIGHSLGAHIAGLTSKSLSNRFGRITGLDPAGLTYHNVSPCQRLDSTDADYVDVMHTNGCRTFWDPWLSCYGIDENIGHTDFWPNGGKYQPACKDDVKGELGCDHMMSYKYYLESIDYSIEDTFFLARNCSDWDAYSDGNCPCSDGAQYMGFFANAGMPGIFYLNTSASIPYAERDAVCSPGETVNGSKMTIIIASSTGSTLFLLIIVVVAIVFIRRRKTSTVSSGLLTEEDDDIIEEDAEPRPAARDEDDESIFREEDLRVTPEPEDLDRSIPNDDERLLIV